MPPTVSTGPQRLPTSAASSSPQRAPVKQSRYTSAWERRSGGRQQQPLLGEREPRRGQAGRKAGHQHLGAEPSSGPARLLQPLQQLAQQEALVAQGGGGEALHLGLEREHGPDRELGAAELALGGGVARQPKPAVAVLPLGGGAGAKQGVQLDRLQEGGGGGGGRGGRLPLCPPGPGARGRKETAPGQAAPGRGDQAVGELQGGPRSKRWGRWQPLLLVFRGYLRGQGVHEACLQELGRTPFPRCAVAAMMRA